MPISIDLQPPPWTPAPAVTAQRFSTSGNATTSPRCCTTRACPTCLDIAQRHHVRLCLPSTSAPRPLVAAYPATSASASAPVLGGLPAVAQSFEVTTSVPAPFSGHTATTCMHPFGAYETPCTVRQLTPHPTRTVLTTTEHVHARYRRVCHTMPCDRPPRPSTKAQRCVQRVSSSLSTVRSTQRSQTCTTLPPVRSWSSSPRPTLLRRPSSRSALLL